MNPQDVFTPRAPTVNSEMYIHRRDLEKLFKRYILGNKHIVLCGESGVGKSWLYKKILSEQGVDYYVCNLANVHRLGTINLVTKDLADDLLGIKKVSFTESKSAEANIAIAKGSLSNVGTFRISEKDPFAELLNAIRDKSGSKAACLVFENLEQIISDEKLIREFTGLLLLLDDERYSRFHVNIIVVGTPCDLRDYIVSLDNSNTVINRINELPEVGSLSPEGAAIFIEKGFFKLLKLKVADDESDKIKGKLINEIVYYTDAVPQFLHELCLEIAVNSIDNENIIDDKCIIGGLIEWVKTSMISEIALIRENLSSNGKKIGRNNQALLAMALIDKPEFTAREVEDTIRKQFPKSTKNKKLNVARILTGFIGNSAPLIRQSKIGNTYRFKSPKAKVIIRVLLDKADNEVISINEQILNGRRNGSI